MAEDAPRPRAWAVKYIEGRYPTEFTNPDEFSHEDGEPWDAPGADVLVTTYTDEYGNRCEITDSDFVLYLRTAGLRRTEGAFVGADDGALKDRMLARESIVAFSGKWQPDEEFNRVRRDARFDDRFPASLADWPRVQQNLEDAAAETGRNAIQVIEQAWYQARNLGHPYSTRIAPIIEEALFNALKSKYHAE